MVHAYTPTYYRSLHDSITSICNTILPFSFKKRRIPAILAAEQQLSKQQTDNLKWQQDSFHQILKLMGLCKEGILAESEVSAFRTHLLERLIASPIDYEQSTILRDKLIFLQELLYAKCISEEEYHASKRPLLQRLAIQGAEIEAKDVIVGGAIKEASIDEWSVIDLKDEKGWERLTSRNNQKVESPIKQRKGVASAFDFVSPNKSVEFKDDTSGVGCNNIRPAEQRVSNFGFPRNELAISSENPFWHGHLNEKESETKYILMVESSLARSGGDEGKKKPFRVLFQREPKEVYGGDGNGNGSVLEGKDKVNSKKKSWGFDGFRRWKDNDSEDETAPLSLSAKSYCVSYTEQLNPVGEGPDTKKMKQKSHPNGTPTDFFIDKVLGENVKKELARIQEELGAKNQNVHLSDDQIETISTRLPIDKEDLTKFFPKTWCDKYGDVVLDVVRKEFNDHVGDVGNPHIAAANLKERNSKRWTTFDDDENSHPNLFAPQASCLASSKNTHASFNSSSIDKGFKYNPFFDM